MATATLAATLFAACTGDEQVLLPNGAAGSPLTFTASVKATAAATRSTADGTFDDGSPIALCIGDVWKTYAFDAATRQFAAADADDCFYWNGADDTKAVDAAWYPATLAADTGTNPPALQLNADQRTDLAYAAADILFAPSGQTLHRSAEIAGLVFAHFTARVVFNLRCQDGSVSTDDLHNAAVYIGKDNVALGLTADPSAHALATDFTRLATVQPHACPSVPAGYVRSYEALLPPQNLRGKVFIRIVLPDGEELAYTPEAEEANLESGQQYTYNVNVVRYRHLEVSLAAGDRVPWTSDYDVIISTAEELREYARAMREEKEINGVQTGYVRALQIADIDLGGELWEPITSHITNIVVGTSIIIPSFRGVYNGNGHIISNMKIEGEYMTAGLFESAHEGAVLTGIHLRNAEINNYRTSEKNHYWVGGIVGYSENATISLCSVEGKFTQVGGASVGGIAGSSLTTTISRCRTDVEISSTNCNRYESCIGGILGLSNRSFILSSIARGNLSAEGDAEICVGGLIGMMDTPSILACCMVEESTLSCKGPGENYAGGLVGTIVRDAYCIGSTYLYSSYTLATPSASGGTNHEDELFNKYDKYGNPSVIAENCYGASESDRFHRVREYAGTVESASYYDMYDQQDFTYYPYTLHYTPTAFPAYGVTPTQAVWSAAAWNNTNPPTLNMNYEGE